jgi:hypothetical protein
LFPLKGVGAVDDIGGYVDEAPALFDATAKLDLAPPNGTGAFEDKGG